MKITRKQLKVLLETFLNEDEYESLTTQGKGGSSKTQKSNATSTTDSKKPSKSSGEKSSQNKTSVEKSSQNKTSVDSKKINKSDESEISIHQRLKQSDRFDLDWAKKELNKTADFFNNTVLPWADDLSTHNKLYVDDEYHTIIVAHPDDPDTVAPLIPGTFKAGTHIEKEDMIAKVKDLERVTLQTLYNNLQYTSKNLGIDLPFQSLSDEERRDKMSQLYSKR